MHLSKWSKTTKPRGKPKGGKPLMLPKGVDLVSVGEFKAAESRVESLAKDVNTLRGEIGDVKHEVGSIRVI